MLTIELKLARIGLVQSFKVEFIINYKILAIKILKNILIGF